MWAATTNCEDTLNYIELFIPFKMWAATTKVQNGK